MDPLDNQVMSPINLRRLHCYPYNVFRLEYDTELSLISCSNSKCN